MADEKKMIFAYFLQISNHMWEDKENSLPFWTAHDQWTDANECNIEVFDELVDFIAERKFNMLVLDIGDGVRLNSHPEIAAPDAWSIDYLKEKLAYIRSKGIEVIPKLNFSACHCVWQHEWRHRMLLPEYPQFCRDIIDEVIEIFDHPRFFHLGLDEETAAHQAKLSSIIVRNEGSLWKFAEVVFDECLKNGVRPWIFSDMYWHRPDEFVRHMPKEVLQSNWYYGMWDYREDHNDFKYINTYLKLDELGYDQIPTMSAYTRFWNSDRGFRYLKDKLNPEHLLGYITIPWAHTTRDAKYSLMDDADRFYMARKRYYPETFEGEIPEV